MEFWAIVEASAGCAIGVVVLAVGAAVAIRILDRV